MDQNSVWVSRHLEAEIPASALKTLICLGGIDLGCYIFGSFGRSKCAGSKKNSERVAIE